MGGQPAEQIIAGVVLSERLAVTMYGAIHRAQYAGQRNMRGLVIDPKMLAETSFRAALVSTKDIATVVGLDHPNIVPTIAVESGGPDVVVVTRGVGRYVTVQDLIAAARANRREGGKLSLPVAAAIGKSVVEALAAAHRAKVVHGAVHPRSVLVDEDGAVRLGDFVVGRALTTAVAQGADSSLWRGLAGYLAPELVVGEDPTPSSDVFAAGAMLFTMLSGEVPPGTLHVTPAVERLVQRALDTDLARRYRTAADLLENLVEAFEDDRWTLADRGEIIKAAGLSGTDANIDDATEDLLASLGSSAKAVQVTPMRPSVDIRAEAIASRHQQTPSGVNRLQALLADLDDSKEHTAVEEPAFKRDPISELIHMDPRKKEAIVQTRRVPSLDDPDDELPPREAAAADPGRGSPRPRRSPSVRSNDEAAAMDALAQLDAPVRLSSAADAVELAAAKLEQAAKRAEAAAARVDTNAEATPRPPPAANAISTTYKVAKPLPDPVVIDELPPPRVRSRAWGIVGLLLILGLGGGIAYVIVQNQKEAEQAKHDAKAAKDKQEQEDADRARQMAAAYADAGAIAVRSNPAQAGVWLKLGRTTDKGLDTLPLSSAQMHEIRIDGLDGFEPIDTQVIATHWSGGDKDHRTATIRVPLEPVRIDPRTKKPHPVKLPPTPPEPPRATGFSQGRGPIHIETTPPGAEVWLFIGTTDSVRFDGLLAGRAYELRVLKDGYLPGFISITVDDWRDPKGDPKEPIDTAKKLPLLDRSIELTVDPAAPKRKGA